MTPEKSPPPTTCNLDAFVGHYRVLFEINTLFLTGIKALLNERNWFFMSQLTHSDLLGEIRPSL